MAGKVRFLAFLSILILSSACFAQTFKARQLDYPRVRAAYRQKEQLISRLFQKKGVGYPPSVIFIRVFKRERQLELWARSSNVDTFTLVRDYDICALSGDLGPKRMQGDLQAPEGFYYINGFNPCSQFHLSLRINYPNSSDRILGKHGRLGGDIFIHGSCVTIGCIPITDDKIKELYIVAVEARNQGQRRIPVHIFPTRLNEKGMEWLRGNYSDNQGLIQFWEGLRQGFEYFEKRHVLTTIRVGKNGRYIIQSPNRMN